MNDSATSTMKQPARNGVAGVAVHAFVSAKPAFAACVAVILFSTIAGATDHEPRSPSWVPQEPSKEWLERQQLRGEEAQRLTPQQREERESDQRRYRFARCFLVNLDKARTEAAVPLLADACNELSR